MTNQLSRVGDEMSLILLSSFLILTPVSSEHENYENQTQLPATNGALHAPSLGSYMSSPEDSKILRKVKRDCLDSEQTPWEHRYLGEFGVDHTYCLPDCGRSHNTCCRPQEPTKLRIGFILMKAYHSLSQDYAFDDNTIGKYLKDDEHKAVFITVGHISDPVKKNIPQLWQIQMEYAKQGMNAIIVDWHGESTEAQEIQDLRSIGAMIGSFIGSFDLEHKTVCVGFGIGAHLCGETGKFMIRHGKQLGRCHMLDPVANLFEGCPKVIRQNREDCKVTVTIHTSQAADSVPGNRMTSKYGISYPSGHCDFWINSGHVTKQPNCNLNTRKLDDKDSRKIIACAHYRVLDIYLSQIRSECDFVGIRAKHCGGSQECVPDKSGFLMRLPPHDTCGPNKDESYLVETSVNEHPYCNTGQVSNTESSAASQPESPKSEYSRSAHSLYNL